MTPKQALEKIKNIELSHIAYYDDDDYYDDDYIPSYEESDGTIEENYPEEIKVIEKALGQFEKLIKSVDIEYLNSLLPEDRIKLLSALALEVYFLGKEWEQK